MTLTKATYSMIDGAPVNVRDYGAVGDGVTNDWQAFTDAWAAIVTNGGTLVIPAGTYLLNADWVLAKLQKNYRITGYGAVITSGASVVHAIDISGGGQQGQLVIEGLTINHGANTTASTAIRNVGGTYAKIIRCSFSARNNVAYNAIKMTDAYWALVDKCQFYGTGSPKYGSAIWVNGECNATKIQNNQVSEAVSCVYVDANVSDGMVNGLRIVNNDFESITNAITFNNPASPAYTAAGVLVTLNRIESATTFLNISGSLADESSYPLTSYNNYFVAGNVTNYIQNPNNQFVSIFEQTNFGSASVDNLVGGPNNFTVIASDNGSNFQIQNRNGVSSWESSHLVMGTFHVWVDSSGRLRIKDGAPSSSTDGTVVGTQS